MSKLQADHLKIYETNLISTVETMARDLKFHGEENEKLWIYVEKCLLYVQTIEDVRAFNRDYIEQLSKIDESYMKDFEDIKSSLVMLEKKLKIVNLDQVATTFVIDLSNFEKFIAHILDVVRDLPTSGPWFSPNIMS